MYMKRECNRCQSAFNCREDRRDLCHCTHIYILPEIKNYIKENYDDCLCHNCLKEVKNNFHSSGVNPKYKR